MKIYEKKRTELKELCDNFKNFNGYKLNREKFNEFYINGNRLNYEHEYFARRGCLMSRGTDAIINKNKDAKLYEIIDAICNEFTWALPAHVESDAETPDKVIDLFSAETAQTLSEIMHYTELPQQICEKIRRLLYERIIEPYENNTFFWERAKHNWAAVCAGCVGMVYLYEFPERFPLVKKRILNTMDCFLSGYGDDGACLEGIGYWAYGFGYFVYFAELLKRFDKTDLFKSEKVARIAEFSQHMFLKNDISVSFSDGFRNGSFNIGLTCFLRKEYKTQIPDFNYRADHDNCYRFAPYLRSFLWLDEELCNKCETYLGEKYFENAEWYINKQKKFAFAAKGGCNAEPHNHNDIGSFIITDGEEQLIADFGAGEYTREYFNPETRYEYFCIASCGHNVPIIDGKYQKQGAQYHAKNVCAKDSKFSLDISGAYGIEELTGLKREFKVSTDKIKMCDTFEFNKSNVTERLVSLIKPEINCKEVKIKSMIIKSNITPAIHTVTVKNHCGHDETVYILDYDVSLNKFECEFIF